MVFLSLPGEREVVLGALRRTKDGGGVLDIMAETGLDLKLVNYILDELWDEHKIAYNQGRWYAPEYAPKKAAALSTEEANVLSVVRKYHRGMWPDEIAQALHIETARVKGVLYRLLDKGYIQSINGKAVPT